MPRPSWNTGMRSGRKHVVKFKTFVRGSLDGNGHRQEVDFDERGLFYITPEHLRINRASRKLFIKLRGTFRIQEKVGNTFSVELPPEDEVHTDFSPDKLRKASRTEPLSGQIPDLLPTLEVDGEQEWKIDEILDSQLYYLNQNIARDGPALRSITGIRRGTTRTHL